MSRTLKIVLIVVVSLFLLGILGVALCVGGVALCASHGMQSAREGEAFGPGSTEQGCVDEALSRIEGCGDMDMACSARGSSFVIWCLRAAPKDPAFCAPLPPETTLVGEAQWTSTFCAEHVRPNHQPCASLASQITAYCDEIHAGRGTDSLGTSPSLVEQ